MSHPLTHGIDTFFREVAVSRRLVASVLLVISALSFALFAGLGRKVAESHMLDVKRFGFAGPEQRVEHMYLEEESSRQTPGIFGMAYLATAARKGGKSNKQVTNDPHAPVAEPKPPGLGDSEEDVLAKARALALHSPVVRSEDLVIEKLVRPEYPAEAREKNMEGIVEMLALVDTSGAVVQVQIVGGTR